MRKGWIKMYRDIFEWPMYFAEPFTRAQAWMDILLLTNHQEKIVNIRGNIIKVKRGELAWSQDHLAQRWKWSRGRVKRYFSILQNEHQIVQQKTPFIWLTKVINYNQYQQNNTTNDTADSTSDSTTDGHKQERKNDKECYHEHVFLTHTEYEKLVQELTKDRADDLIQRLNDYIGSKGKKYKSHYHTILTWYRKEKPFDPDARQKGESFVDWEIRLFNKKNSIPSSQTV